MQNFKLPESFQSWDTELSGSTTAVFAGKFPFVLTRRSAIHVDLIAELTDNLMHAKEFAASREALAQMHMQKFHDAELKYYDVMCWQKENELVPTATPKKFGCFDDPDGYNGFIPSEHFLTTVWMEWMQERRVAKLDRLVNGAEGEV